MRAEFGVDAGLVTNGVDAERYRPARDEGERQAARAAFGMGDRLTVLAVGGIEPRKGSLTLIEAFAQLRAARKKGTGPFLARIRCSSSPAARRCSTTATRSIASPPCAPSSGSATTRSACSARSRTMSSSALYRAADVFCFPSIKEGFGLVVLEALASDLPVVASDIDVLRTVLRDGDSALLAPCGDAAAFADALARVGARPRAARPAARRRPRGRRAPRLGRGGRWPTRHAYRAFLDGRVAVAR